MKRWLVYTLLGWLQRNVGRHIRRHIDEEKWQARAAEIESIKKKIRALASKFN